MWDLLTPSPSWRVIEDRQGALFPRSVSHSHRPRLLPIAGGTTPVGSHRTTVPGRNSPSPTQSSHAIKLIARAEEQFTRATVFVKGVNYGPYYQLVAAFLATNYAWSRDAVWKPPWVCQWLTLRTFTQSWSSWVVDHGGLSSDARIGSLAGWQRWIDSEQTWTLGAGGRCYGY